MLQRTAGHLSPRLPRPLSHHSAPVASHHRKLVVRRQFRTTMAAQTQWNRNSYQVRNLGQPFPFLLPPCLAALISPILYSIMHTNRIWQSSLEALNTLQSNAAAIAAWKKERRAAGAIGDLHEEMLYCAKALNIDVRIGLFYITFRQKSPSKLTRRVGFVSWKC